MDTQDYKITCPRCGNEFKSTARCCINCGYINPNNPENAEYFSKYSQNEIEEYTVKGYTGDISPQKKEAPKIGIDVTFGNIGNFSLCFWINFLCYILGVIGISIYYYSSSSDVYAMMDSGLSYVLLLFTLCSFAFYSTQLVFMKMNKKWYYALIPILNLYMFSDAIVEKKWQNILVFIPVVGEFYLIYLLYQMGKSFQKSGLLTVLFPYIMFPVIGFGGSCFHNTCYISERDTLEKEYGKKKVYRVSGTIIIAFGFLMIIYSNAVNINRTMEKINSYYLYYAAKKTVRRTQIKVENNLHRCSNKNNTMYFYLGDLYDYFFLPFYVYRDPIEAYVKVVATPKENSPLYHYDYYISVTDGKYGFAEIPIDELELKSIKKYPKLKTVYKDGNQCYFRRNA